MADKPTRDIGNSMRIAVVTPSYQTKTEWIEKCIASVANQTYRNVFHVIVSDGCGSQAIEQFPDVEFIALPKNIGDYGDTPRSLGSIYALAKGADAIAYLDADNWYDPEHLESLIKLHRSTGADVVTSYRLLVQLDGQPLGVCPHSDGIAFSDTSCMLFTKAASEVATSWWTIPKAYHALDDRVIWDRVIKNNHSISCTRNATMCYRTAFEHHYRMFDTAPPKESKLGMPIWRLRNTVLDLHNRARQLAPPLYIDEEKSDT